MWQTHSTCYCIVQNFGRRKHWWIWQFIANLPKFYPPIFLTNFCLQNKVGINKITSLVILICLLYFYKTPFWNTHSSSFVFKRADSFTRCTQGNQTKNGVLKYSNKTYIWSILKIFIFHNSVQNDQFANTFSTANVLCYTVYRFNITWM